MADATAGSKLYIGTSAQADDLSDFEADTYVEIKQIEDLGEVGMETAAIQFRPVAGLGQHLKGSSIGKVVNLVIGRNPADAGQQALRDASRSHLDFNFKLQLANAPGAAPTKPSTFYWRGLVFPATTALGNGESGVIKDTHPIGIQSDIIELEPGNVPGLPGSLAANASSSSVIAVTFTGGSGASSHQMRYSLHGQNAFTAWATFTSGSNITGLSPNTQYDIEVRGVNASGHGPAAATSETTDS